MRTTMRWTALALLPLAFASCGVPITSGAQFSEGVEPTGALTFAFNDERDLAMGDPRLTNNQYFEDRLHEAIGWELGLRGIRPVDLDESPDLLAHHHLTLAQHEMVDEIIDAEGYSRTEVYSYEAGTLVIHLVDADTGGNFWVSWGQANIEAALTGPDQMRVWVYDIVRQMFATWPTATP